MSKNQKNFCGPYYTPIWLKMPLSLIFNPACKIHDNEYQKRNKPRLLIDFIFFLDMLVILFVMFRVIVLNVLKFSLGVIMCPLFFVLVVLFGWISYRKSNGKADLID